MRPIGWLTGTGLALVVGAALSLVAGWALGYAELAIFSSAALTALAAGMAWLARPFPLEITRMIEPTRVQRGGVALGLVSVTNRGGRPSPALSAEDIVGPDRVAVPLPRLAANSHRTNTYRLPTAHRGVIPVGPLTILREDPLGLLRRARRVGHHETLWVHPVVHPLVAVPAGQSRHLDGPTADTAPQGSLTFHAIREYVPGDDCRFIHWPSTARLGTLMVCQHVDTSQPRTTVLLDTRRSSYDDDSFEEAMDVAASVVASSTSRRFPVTLHTTCGVSVGGRGARGEGAAFLDKLAELTPSSAGALADAATRLFWRRRAEALVVITGHPDEEDARAVATMKRHFALTTLVAIGPPTAGTPQPTPPEVSVIRTTTAAEFAAVWNRSQFLTPRLRA